LLINFGEQNRCHDNVLIFDDGVVVIGAPFLSIASYVVFFRIAINVTGIEVKIVRGIYMPQLSASSLE
jgi:hypothetical protein